MTDACTAACADCAKRALRRYISRNTTLQPCDLGSTMCTNRRKLKNRVVKYTGERNSFNTRLLLVPLPVRCAMASGETAAPWHANDAKQNDKQQQIKHAWSPQHIPAPLRWSPPLFHFARQTTEWKTLYERCEGHLDVISILLQLHAGLLLYLLLRRVGVAAQIAAWPVVRRLHGCEPAPKGGSELLITCEGQAETSRRYFSIRRDRNRRNWCLQQSSAPR